MAMTPGSPVPAPQRGHVYGAIAVSVAIHAMLFFALARATFVPPISASDPEPGSMLVTLTRQPVPVVEEPAAADVAVTEELPSELSAEPPPDTESEVAEAVTEADEPSLDNRTDDARPFTGLNAGINTATTGETEATSAATTSGLTPQFLQSAVSSYLQRQRGIFTADWIAECERYRKQHGTRDCEEIRNSPEPLGSGARAGRDAALGSFAGVNRPVQHALLTERFEKQNVLMKELMEIPGVQGNLARQRFFLNREIMGYLNGNPSPYGPAFQFNCKGGPCVYKYSETVEQPAPSQARENEFRVVPALFGSQR